MNKIEFNQTGGFPLSTNILDAMQEAYGVFNSLGHLAGNKAIISGCIVTGSSVSDGVVFINGEVLPFKGGPKSANIFVKEEAENGIFEDGSHKPIIVKRYATFGSSTPDKTYQWADFVRAKTLIELNTEKANAQEVHQSLSALNTTITGIRQSLQAEIDEVKAALHTHISNKNNPHSVAPSQVGILLVGSIFLGNIQGKPKGWIYQGQGYTVTLLERNQGGNHGGDDLYKVVFANPLPHFNYNVLCAFTSTKQRSWSEDNDLIYTIREKGDEGFVIAVREVNSDIQSVNLDFIIIEKK